MEWEFGVTICKLLYIQWINNKVYVAFPGVAVVRNLPISAGDARDAVSIPGSGRYPEGGKWLSTPVSLHENFHG